jgi:carbonic anhydrase/acetyltransferase-like protein (isoleucine patch superfamily)
MRKPLTHLNSLSRANQFFFKPSTFFSGFLSLALLTLVSCSYLEDFVEPDNPKPGEEKMFRPVTFNRPVLPVHASANEATFIDPTVKITGAEHILLGRKIYIGPFASLLAGDETLPHVMTVANNQETEYAKIKIEQETNIQDNVAIYADFERSQDARNKVNALHIEGVEIGERVILAHGCTVKGPAQIGIEGKDIPVDPDTDQEVFISFGAEIDGAILEKNTGVSALARVGPGIRLRSGYIVLPGKNVTTQEEADNINLGKVRKLVEDDIEFNEGVLEVNIAFSKVYTQLFRDNPFNVFGINFDPGSTGFNPERDKPEFAGIPTREPEFRNRIIGEIYFGNSLQEFNSVAGNRIVIRADEGEPFAIGKIASMGNNVIFHALEETPIQTGNNVSYGEGVIVHGGGRRPLTGGGDNAPTIVENDVVLDDHAVVFRSLIGKGAKIGKRALIVNTDIAPGTVVPDKAIYVGNAFFGTVEW